MVASAHNSNVAFRRVQDVLEIIEPCFEAVHVPETKNKGRISIKNVEENEVDRRVDLHRADGVGSSNTKFDSSCQLRYR